MLTSKASQNKRRRRPKQKKSERKPVYAAIDLGTNNCRLLVAEEKGQRFRVVDSYSQIVRLGEGLTSSGKLSDAAIARTIEALKTIRDKLKSHNVKRLRCVATQACRAADNGRDFIELVQKEVGFSFKVISPKEEARLAVVGALDLIDPKKEVALVVDIGGGSTELCWVDAAKARKKGMKGSLEKTPMLAWASFPLGVVTLSEQFPERNDPDWYPEMLSYARNMLQGFERGLEFSEAFAQNRGHLIGTSGTVTSLCAVHLDLDRYIRSVVDGSWFARDDALAARARLSSLTREERSQIGCIGDGRSDLVLAGCAILEAIWELWPCDQMRVADRGLREGLLISLIHGKPARKRKRKPKTKDNDSSAPDDTAAEQETHDNVE
ncbi:Ppx/GppA phosphatase family protein [Ponticaulis sp.]|uniref:Ppx/GppA phosphatase family protein n=1 Tax=Ponticaulis sp. TaxID=2020902 RepID=UPI000B75AEB7|nr:Ppx/GppA phosphatase family protein [Ponticaulis sp.]MAI91504.1 exopolyphosphatase [Ponticaulis sp.]OUX97467.1 MAG: exopolyphosphatase [Hyphomonadaceae bacterium TMED5]|tara:strand:+ start:12577 stop:13716 length:1140 start_codon:yes stop_codon:yes gene_type:complete